MATTVVTRTRAVRRTFLWTLLLVFLAIAALFVVDTFLARIEKVESGAEAARLFAEGQALMKQGENSEAIERFRDAGLIDRGNRDYQRALAEAQLAAGRTADAESTLAELLEGDSTDALANLLMARALVKENKVEDAVSYFHRAIYGRWKEDEAGNRLRTRFELIDILAARGSKEDLLSELLEVEELAPQDVQSRLRMGRLFLQAGAPARAAAVFDGIVHEDPANADADAGLGEAEFEQGKYRDAQRDFAATLRVRPDDDGSRRRLDACNELLTLDPTIRALSPAERLRRSRELLEMTVQEAGKCAGANPPPGLRALLDKAGVEEKERVRAAREGEAADAGLDLAEQIWQARRKECREPPDANSPLALVLARLAQ